MYFCINLFKRITMKRKIIYLALIIAVGLFTAFMPSFTGIEQDEQSMLKDKEETLKNNYVGTWGNGVKKEEGQLVDGVREGTWTMWYPNGNRSELGQYRHGARIGTWTFWNEDSKFNRIEYYYTPSLTEVEICIDELEKIAAESKDDWRQLAICAGYLVEKMKTQAVQDEALLQQGLDWINASIEIEEHYWNMLIKTRILTRVDAKLATGALIKTINLGKKEIPDFITTDDFRQLNAAMNTLGGC